MFSNITFPTVVHAAAFRYKLRLMWKGEEIIYGELLDKVIKNTPLLASILSEQNIDFIAPVGFKKMDLDAKVTHYFSVMPWEGGIKYLLVEDLEKKRFQNAFDFEAGILAYELDPVYDMKEHEDLLSLFKSEDKEQEQCFNEIGSKARGEGFEFYPQIITELKTKFTIKRN
jgi:hypothetical protein